MKSAITTLAAALALLSGCGGPALQEVPALETAGAGISIELAAIAPLWSELLAGPAPASRAIIGSSRAQFTLYDASDGQVDSWEVSVGGNNSLVSSLRMQTHSIDAAWAEAPPPFRLEVKIYNAAVSADTPVVSGSARDLAISEDEDTYVSIRCLPASPVALVSGTRISRQLKPFVMSDRLVTVLGEEAWYSFALTGERLLFDLVPDSGNASTLAGVIYDAAGAGIYNLKFSATAAAPVSVLKSLGAAGTYYLGLAQSRGIGAGDNGFSLRILDGPADPPAPALTSGAGTVTATWISDPDVGTYTLYYGVPLSYDQSSYQTILKIQGITAVAGELSRTLSLPPTATYGFWLTWTRAGITATTPGMTWSSPGSYTQATGTPPLAKALHAITEVNSWTCEAIGDITDGAGSFGSGEYTLSGGGVLGLQGSPNPTWLQFLHKPLEGDFTLKVRVLDLSPGGQYVVPMAGIGVRTDTSPGSLELLVGARDAFQNTELVYPQSGSGGMFSGPTATLASVWLKIVRVGDGLTAYRSTDGATWAGFTLPGGAMTLSGAVRAGAFVIGGDWSVPATARFDNLEVTQP